jgi:hypothetical protein
VEQDIDAGPVLRHLRSVEHLDHERAGAPRDPGVAPARRDQRQAVLDGVGR